jgi:radical SAM protein with 4Fe4S-binding SPASM domain
MPDIENKISPYLKVSQDVIGKNLDIEKILDVFKKINLSIKKMQRENFDLEFLNIINDQVKFSNFFNYMELFKVVKMDEVNIETSRIVRYLYFRYQFNLASNQKKVFDYPPYLLIEPNAACNLKCPMCFQIDKTFTRKPFMGIMKWDLFTKVVDEANEIGVGAITLASRGEPLMHPRISDMLNYISKKDNIFELKINSNGSFLTEELCHEIFKSKVTTFVISADHYEKKTFEELRKFSNFEKIVNNVKMLYSIRKEFYKDCETEIRISGIDFYKNLDKKKFQEFWSPFSDNVSSSDAFERWDTYNNKKNEDVSSPCSYLWDRMYVWHDGKCNPCDADYKSYLSYGNVKENSIAQVWNSDELKKHRKTHLEKKRKNLIPCDRCGIEFN